MKLSVNNMQNALDDSTTGPEQKEIFGAILSAINDWPTEISSFDDYIFALQREIGQTPTKDNLDSFSESLSFKDSAWKAESIAEILRL